MYRVSIKQLPKSVIVTIYLFSMKVISSLDKVGSQSYIIHMDKYKITLLIFPILIKIKEPVRFVHIDYVHNCWGELLQSTKQCGLYPLDDV